MKERVKKNQFKPENLILRVPEREPFYTKGSSNSYLDIFERVLFTSSQTESHDHIYGGAFVKPTDCHSKLSCKEFSFFSAPLCSFQYTKKGFGFSNGSLTRDFIPLFTLSKYLKKSHELILMDSLVLSNVANLVLVIYDNESSIYQIILFNTLSQEVTLFPLRFEVPIMCFSVSVIPPSYYNDSITSNLKKTTLQGESRIQLILGLKSSLLMGFDFEIRRVATQLGSSIIEISNFSHQLLNLMVPTCLYVNNKESPTGFTMCFGSDGGKFGVLRYTYDYRNASPILKNEYNSFGNDFSEEHSNLVNHTSPITWIEYLPSLDHSDKLCYLLLGQGSQPFLMNSQQYSPNFSLIQMDSDFNTVKRILEVSSPTSSVGSFVKASISYHQTGYYLAISKWIGSSKPNLQFSVSHFNFTNPQFDPFFEMVVSSDPSDIPLDIHLDTRSGTFKVLNLNSISVPINFLPTIFKIRDISSKFILNDFIKLVSDGLTLQKRTDLIHQNCEGQSLFENLAAGKFPSNCGTYPISSLSEAVELANFINDTLSSVKKELFYYILLDYPFSSERSGFAQNHQISEATCILIKGYWNIDHGHYLEGVLNICSSKLSPHFPQEILELLIMSRQNKAICLFWDFLIQMNLNITPKNPKFLLNALFSQNLRTSIQFIASYPNAESKKDLYLDFFSLLFEPGYLSLTRATILRWLISPEVEEHLLYFMSTHHIQDSPRCKDRFRSSFQFYIDYLISKDCILEAVEFYQIHQELAAAYGITTMPRQLEQAVTKTSQASLRNILITSGPNNSLKRPNDTSRSYSEIKVAKVSINSELPSPKPFFSALSQQPPGLSIRDSYQKANSDLSDIDSLPLTPRSPKLIRALNAFDLPKAPEIKPGLSIFSQNTPSFGQDNTKEAAKPASHNDTADLRSYEQDSMIHSVAIQEYANTSNLTNNFNSTDVISISSDSMPDHQADNNSATNSLELEGESPPSQNGHNHFDEVSSSFEEYSETMNLDSSEQPESGFDSLAQHNEAGSEPDSNIEADDLSQNLVVECASENSELKQTPEISATLKVQSLHQNTESKLAAPDESKYLHSNLVPDTHIELLSSTGPIVTSNEKNALINSNIDFNNYGIDSSVGPAISEETEPIFHHLDKSSIITSAVETDSMIESIRSSSCFTLELPQAQPLSNVAIETNHIYECTQSISNSLDYDQTSFESNTDSQNNQDQVGLNSESNSYQPSDHSNESHEVSSSTTPRQNNTCLVSDSLIKQELQPLVLKSDDSDNLDQVSPICETDVLLEQEVSTISSNLPVFTEQAQFKLSLESTPYTATSPALEPNTSKNSPEIVHDQLVSTLNPISVKDQVQPPTISAIIKTDLECPNPDNNTPGFESENLSPFPPRDHQLNPSSSCGTTPASPKNIGLLEVDPIEPNSELNNLPASSNSVSSPPQDTSIELPNPNLVDLSNHHFVSTEGKESDLNVAILYKDESSVNIFHSNQDEASDEASQKISQLSAFDVSNQSPAPKPDIDSDSNVNVLPNFQVNKSSFSDHTHKYLIENEVDATVQIALKTDVNVSLEDDALLHPSDKAINLNLSSKSGSSTDNDENLDTFFKNDFPSDKNALSHISAKDANLGLSLENGSPSIILKNTYTDHQESLDNQEATKAENSTKNLIKDSHQPLELTPNKDDNSKSNSEISRQLSEESSHKVHFSESNDTVSSNNSTPRKKAEERFPNFVQIESDDITEETRTPRKRTPRNLHNETLPPKSKKTKKANPRQK